MTKREMLVAAGMVAGGALMTVALLTGRAGPAPSAEAAGAPAVAAASAPRSAAPANAAPRWSDANKRVWVGNQRRAIAYEVEADNTINVWMRAVRPSLVVRCARGRTEVFVVTEAAARIEPDTEDHTVSFAFNGGTETSELWPDSEEHDALFAPNGAAFARRLTAARTLRFAFTPHNAPRAIARFQIGGLEQKLAPAISECGWKK